MQRLLPAVGLALAVLAASLLSWSLARRSPPSPGVVAALQDEMREVRASVCSLREELKRLARTQATVSAPADDDARAERARARHERDIAVAQALESIERRLSSLEDTQIVNRTAPLEAKTLLDAIRRGAVDDLRALLASGVDPDLLSQDGETALTVAAAEGKEEAARLLLDSRADINLRGRRGFIPLVWALEMDHEDLALDLLLRGSDIEARDDDGTTPIMWAAWKGHTRVVRELIARGADVNALSDAGSAALADAARGGRIEIARLLLENGASPNPSETPSESPLHIAAKRGDSELAALLRAYGARE